MKRHIHDHFQQKDPVLFAVLQRMKDPDDIAPTKDLFTDLCDAIISQQLSVKVSQVLVERLRITLGGSFTPDKILQLPDERIREQGISHAKIKSLKDVSTRMIQGNIVFTKLRLLSDEQVIEKLIEVKGIGPWTAQMFLMFSLGREDVFSPGDGGLRRAIKNIYGFASEPTDEEMKKLSLQWAPYRTYACKILWKSLDLK